MKSKVCQKKEEIFQRVEKKTLTTSSLAIKIKSIEKYGI